MEVADQIQLKFHGVDFPVINLKSENPFVQSPGNIINIDIKPKVFYPTEQPDYFNAGMFVMTPCLEQLEDFGEALDSAPIAGYAEQDFLNHYFKVR